MKFNNKYHTVGITGHRDLLKHEISEYKEKIKIYLQQLKEDIEKPLLLLSPLADGADRIFIEVGVELDLEYIVILPMPINLYVKDFSKLSLEEFNSLLISAKDQIICSFEEGNNKDNCSKRGYHRSKQYKKVGIEIAKSDSLVVLWDGVDNNKLGGTSDIVRYRLNQDMDYHFIKVKREKG